MSSLFLGLEIFSNRQKSIYDVQTTFITRELEDLQSKNENLEDEKAEYEELCDTLSGKDKEDTVQYRLAKAEIKLIEKELDEIADEEADLNFLKTQSESIAQAYNTEAQSYKSAADKQIKNEFTFA